MRAAFLELMKKNPPKQGESKSPKSEKDAAKKVENENAASSIESDPTPTSENQGGANEDMANNSNSNSNNNSSNLVMEIDEDTDTEEENNDLSEDGGNPALSPLAKKSASAIIRKVVSKKKKRFQEDGFDLDLSCMLPQQSFFFFMHHLYCCLFYYYYYYYYSPHPLFFFLPSFFQSPRGNLLLIFLFHLPTFVLLANPPFQISPTGLLPWDGPRPGRRQL